MNAPLPAVALNCFGISFFLAIFRSTSTRYPSGDLVVYRASGTRGCYITGFRHANGLRSEAALLTASSIQMWYFDSWWMGSHRRYS
jgi:hypothetical protein